MELRISFNPFTNQFLSGGLCHSDDIRKAGQIQNFDKFIRGIIVDGVLYLRLYYPKPDLSELSLAELEEKSFDLLFDYKAAVLEAVKKSLGIKIKKVEYNYTNDLLRGLKIANI